VALKQKFAYYYRVRALVVGLVALRILIGGNTPCPHLLRGLHPLRLTILVLLNFLAGANPSQRNHKGSAPLLGAAMNGHLECVKLLLQAGVDVNTEVPRPRL